MQTARARVPLCSLHQTVWQAPLRAMQLPSVPHECVALCTVRTDYLFEMPAELHSNVLCLQTDTQKRSTKRNFDYAYRVWQW